MNTIARYCTRRLHVPSQEWDDCIQEILTNGLLQEGRKRCLLITGELSGDKESDCAACIVSGCHAYLSACAKNIALKYLLRLKYRRKHECAWPDIKDDAGMHHPYEVFDHSPSPENELLKNEFWYQIECALKKLTPSQQVIFNLRFQDEKEDWEIAQITGRSLHAVEMAISRIRVQYRRILMRHGYDERALSEFPPPPPFVNPDIDPPKSDDED